MNNLVHFFFSFAHFEYCLVPVVYFTKYSQLWPVPEIPEAVYSNETKPVPVMLNIKPSTIQPLGLLVLFR